MSLHTVLFIICFEDFEFFIVFLIFVKILPSDCEICLKNWNVVMLQWGHNFFFLFITYHTFLVIVTRLFFFKTYFALVEVISVN